MSQCYPSQPRSVAWEQLAGCLEDLYHGAWRFIQLRGEPLCAAYIDDDDVDLLGTRASVHELLNTVLEWVRQGRCHARVTNRKREKSELTLLSNDGKHEIKLDLWMSLRQLDRGRQQITYEACCDAIEDPNASIARVDVELESAIFLHHLICKNKQIDAEKNVQRLRSYAQRIKSRGDIVLSEALAGVIANRLISRETESMTLQIIQRRGIGSPKGKTISLSRAIDKLRCAKLAPPRRTVAVAVMGCDGAGKTTLANELASSGGDFDQVFTGKHLYRKSLIYKLTVILIRPLLFQPREQFDETLAPLVYLRACAALQWKLWKSKQKITLIDRSILDFLYVGRKTDSPKFCRGHWLASVFGRRVPTIHCIVSHDQVVRRKEEVTEQGHRKYDNEMFLQFATRCPTDYVAFNNDGDLQESVGTLQRTLSKLKAA